MIKCTSSRFTDDVKLISVVHTTDGWDAIHRDLEKWAHKNFMEFSKCRCCTTVGVISDMRTGWQMN